MSKKAFPLCAILGCVLVLWALAPHDQERAQARLSRLLEEPSSTGETIPEPPRQKEAWKPPVSKVPEAFAKAAALLFEQGMADPRGCEYRAVELTNSERAHGWVLPAKDGEKQRYAVCWNGLVYPVASVGDKADLKKDLKKPDEKQAESESASAPWGFWDRGSILTALLLRLGEGELASELWAMNHPPPKPDEPPAKPKEVDPYLDLAESWGFCLYASAYEAHKSGNDALALQGFRAFAAFAKLARPEANKRGYDPVKEKFQFLGYRQADALLVDQERRAKEGKRATVICVGPNREPDQKKRINAMVRQLDEINHPYWYDQDVGAAIADTPAGFEDDPIVAALIREGEPAVEPLFKCFAEDSRMTRSEVTSGQPPWNSQHCAPVFEAAYFALASILDYWPRKNYPEEDRKQLTARFRKYIDKTKGLSLAERHLYVLADDKAMPQEWLHAATMLLSLEPPAPAPKVWSISPSATPSPKKPRLLGERLRQKKGPSVTELLLKRIEQSKNAYVDPLCSYYNSTNFVAGDLALALGEWEPTAAIPPLKEQAKRMEKANKWEAWALLIEARIKAGDPEALDEYAATIRKVPPKMVDDPIYSRLFGPLIDHPDHPAMAKSAEALFGEPDKSPWEPLLRAKTGGGGDEMDHVFTHSVAELMPTKLLRVPAFHKAVLNVLADKTKAGHVTLHKDGSLDIDVPWHTPGLYHNVSHPKVFIEQDIRHCDLCACLLGENLESAPRCELYWTEAERDKAVAACVAFLRRQQYELEWRDEPLALKGLATAEQVDKGQAVFTLTGEGKEIRVVTGLKLPLEADWITLKESPWKFSPDQEDMEKAPLRDNQRGKVLQAEEVLIDGKWRRYYGFVGCNQITRILADEIDFPPPDPIWERKTWGNERKVWEGVEWVRVGWMGVGPGLHARLDVPPLKIEKFGDLPPWLPADAPLTFALRVRNSHGVEQPSPDATKIVKLRLLYTPEVISPQGVQIPQAKRETDWVELKAKPSAKFKGEKSKTLAATEEMKVATVDLREWFDMSQPGFYRLQLLPAEMKANADKEVGEVRFSLAAPERKSIPAPKP